jgi:hypothetical protein
MVRAVLHAVAEHVDDTALGNLTLQASEEFTPGGTVTFEIEASATLAVSCLGKYGCERSMQNSRS